MASPVGKIQQNKADGFTYNHFPSYIVLKNIQPNYVYFTGLADVIGESDNSTELLTTQEAEIVTDEPIEPIEPANEVEKKSMSMSTWQMKEEPWKVQE